MSLRVLIADDEPMALERLRVSLAGFDDVQIVGEATDGDQAAAMAATIAADIFLIDIQMPGRTGLDVARHLAGGPPEVIFITAFSDFASAAFEIDAVDYLLKPIKQDRLSEALRRAERRRQLGVVPADDARSVPATSPVINGYDDEFWVRKNDGYVRVGVDQIRRIEAARDYALLHTATNSHILRITMSELERRLDPARLLRVHRSAFVKPESVVEVKRARSGAMHLHVADGAVIDIGPSYVRKVMTALGME